MWCYKVRSWVKAGLGTIGRVTSLESLRVGWLVAGCYCFAEDYAPFFAYFFDGFYPYLTYGCFSYTFFCYFLASFFTYGFLTSWILAYYTFLVWADSPCFANYCSLSICYLSSLFCYFRFAFSKAFSSSSTGFCYCCCSSSFFFFFYYCFLCHASVLDFSFSSYSFVLLGFWGFCYCYDILVVLFQKDGTWWGWIFWSKR